MREGGQDKHYNISCEESWCYIIEIRCCCSECAVRRQGVGGRRPHLAFDYSPYVLMLSWLLYCCSPFIQQKGKSTLLMNGCCLVSMAEVRCWISMADATNRVWGWQTTLALCLTKHLMPPRLMCQATLQASPWSWPVSMSFSCDNLGRWIVLHFWCRRETSYLVLLL